MFEITLAALPQNPSVPDGWGNVRAVGVGLGILLAGWFMAKHKFLLYGPKAEEKLNKNGRDWVSFISFLLGFTGVTVLIGAPRDGLGIFSVIIDAPQSFFLFLGETAIGAAIGMWFVCMAITLFTLKKAMKDKGDSIKDIKWGGICAFAFPLGGMPFSWVSTTIANSVIELMNGIPTA